VSRMNLTRRGALGSLLALPPLARSQKLIGETPGRIAPASELVNAYEFADMAQRKLTPATYAEIAPSDRKALDRITFNPRMMVNTTKLDLSVDLFGMRLFSPILIGPAAEQKRFNPEGELAMARGAAAANTGMIVADRCSFPIDQITAQAITPFWYQVYPEKDGVTQRERIDRAVKAGCKALVVTSEIPDWSGIDRVRKGITIPVLLKGVMSPEVAQMAVSHGMQGIVVSNHEKKSIPNPASGIQILPAVAQAVGGRVPILVDGGFCRGSDLIKAVALGAQCVLMCRAALWGLSAYGAEGVQDILGLVQNELARDMMMCGLVNIKSITRAAVTIHKR
jgi:4-hydroxymandelate oxidase